MCGIVAIIKNNKNKNHNLIDDCMDSIIRLEYRGYDSAGILLIQNNKYHIEKCIGALSEKLDRENIKNKLSKDNINITMAHTRWATHGSPSIKNAHPHISNNKKIAVIHNGVILNYQELKSRLINQGFDFYSQTDTEVITNLIQHNLDKYKKINKDILSETLQNTMSELTGNFAVIITHIDFPDMLFVFKNGSPIVIGITKDTYYISSSVLSFLKWTNKYITLADNEMSIIENQNTNIHQKIININNNSNVSKKIQKINNIKIENVSKNNYETFMLKEIYEQPNVAKISMAGRLRGNRITLSGYQELEPYFTKTKSIEIIGCGTAYNAGLIAKYLIEKFVNIKTNVYIASEFKNNFQNKLYRNSIGIFISQSGETADTIEVIKLFEKNKIKKFGIINVPGSTISRMVEAGIYTRAGVEIGVASTKAFTSQLIAIYLLTFKLATNKKMIKDKDRNNYLKELNNIPIKLLKTFDYTTISYLEKIAKALSKAKTILFLSKDISLPIAIEGALKYQELTYNNAMAFPLGELKHGPIALIDKDTISIVLIPNSDNDTILSESINSVEQILSKNGKVLIIINEKHKNISILKKVQYVIIIPNTLDIFYPLLAIIPIQLLSYYTAKILKRNIDKPRNLAKSVTVK